MAMRSTFMRALARAKGVATRASRMFPLAPKSTSARILVPGLRSMSTEGKEFGEKAENKEKFSFAYRTIKWKKMMSESNKFIGLPHDELVAKKVKELEQVLETQGADALQLRIAEFERSLSPMTISDTQAVTVSGAMWLFYLALLGYGLYTVYNGYDAWSPETRERASRADSQREAVKGRKRKVANTAARDARNSK